MMSDRTSPLLPLPPGSRVATAADHGSYGVLISTIGYANRHEGIIEIHSNGQLARLFTCPKGSRGKVSREWKDITCYLVGMMPSKLVTEEEHHRFDEMVNKKHKRVRSDIMDGELISSQKMESPTIEQYKSAADENSKLMKMSDLTSDSTISYNCDGSDDDCGDDNRDTKAPFRYLARDMMNQIWQNLDPKPMDERFHPHYYDALSTSQFEQVAKLVDKFLINGDETPKMMVLESGFGHMQLYMSIYFHCRCIGILQSPRRYFIALKAHSNMHDLITAEEANRHNVENIIPRSLPKRKGLFDLDSLDDITIVFIDSRVVTMTKMLKIRELLINSKVRYVVSRYVILSNSNDTFPFQPLKSLDGIPLTLSFTDVGQVYFYERSGGLPDNVIKSAMMEPEWTRLNGPVNTIINSCTDRVRQYTRSFAYCRDIVESSNAGPMRSTSIVAFTKRADPPRSPISYSW